jgi:hypothetical protein
MCVIFVLIQGIWAGLLCGVALQTLILLFVVWRTDWNKEVYIMFHHVPIFTMLSISLNLMNKTLPELENKLPAVKKDCRM